MELKTFFDNFELLADAPNGVQKLRGMILQLAVQGKLVPQDPNDEPASVLLEKIAAEKERLIQEKKIRSRESLPAIKADEIPYELPESWKWVRLDDYGNWGAGATPNRSSAEYYGGNIPWFKSGELNNGIVTASDEYITKKALRECSLRLNVPGDVLIAMYGATIGKVAITGIESTTNQAVCACTCYEGIFNRFLLMLLMAYKPLFILSGAGGAQPNISRIKIVNTVVPLPPSIEQKRIVAKVDELMALCDELEVRKQKASSNCIRLNDASLDLLITATEANKFNKHWQGICDSFEILYSRPENVVKLRQAILQLAVQGKLVPQDPKDEPASVSLGKVEAEKEWLVKEGRLKRIKSQPVESDEMPCLLPDIWEWTRLEQIGIINPRNDIENGLEVSFVPMKLVPQVIGKDVESEISKWKEIKNGFTHFAEGDVALAKITPCFQNGKSAVMRGLKNGFGAGTTELHIFRPIDGLIIPEYVLLYFKTPLFLDDGVSKMTGSAGQKRVPKIYFSQNPFPLPPLNEQKRIVAKVDELMEFCDGLEAGLSKSQTDCNTLIEAAVAEIMAA